MGVFHLSAVDYVGRVQVLTLEGLPLQVLPINTCGGPMSICVSSHFVHVLCLVDSSRRALLNFEGNKEDLGHPMHSLVGFNMIRA